MSSTLRILLILVSVFVFIYTVRKVRKSQLEIDESMFWILFSVSLVILSIFPQIAEFFTSLLGVESPVNFVFLCVIFIILGKLFFVTIQFSIQKHRLNLLIEKLAILKKEEKDELYAMLTKLQNSGDKKD